METKIKGFQNPKPRIEGGSAAATRPLTPLSLGARLCGPVLAVKGSLRRFGALDCCGPVLGDSLFMRERGELQRRGSPPATDGLFNAGEGGLPPGQLQAGIQAAMGACPITPPGSWPQHGASRSRLEPL